jgi:hypothetical protein
MRRVGPRDMEPRSPLLCSLGSTLFSVPVSRIERGNRIARGLDGPEMRWPVAGTRMMILRRRWNRGAPLGKCQARCGSGAPVHLNEFSPFISLSNSSKQHKQANCLTQVNYLQGLVHTSTSSCLRYIIQRIMDACGQRSSSVEWHLASLARLYGYCAHKVQWVPRYLGTYQQHCSFSAVGYGCRLPGWSSNSQTKTPRVQ